MKWTMDFQGGEALARTLAELPLRVQRGVAVQALKAGAEPIRASAAAHAPRSSEPPHVADHIVIGSSSERGPMAAVAVGPSKDFDERARVYPMAQEFGSVRHEAQPYMRPAFDIDGPKSLDVIRAELWRALIGQGVGSGRTGAGGGLL